MNHAHLEALEKKHAHLDHKIHKEYVHAASDDLELHKLKQERVHLRDEIERVRKEMEQ